MLIRVKVQTGARQETLREETRERFSLTVKAKPKNNEANHQVISLLARHFKLPSGRLRIIKGHRGTSKIVEVSLPP